MAVKIDNRQKQYLEQYISSLPEDKKKSFIERFSGLNDSDKSKALDRIYGLYTKENIQEEKPKIEKQGLLDKFQGIIDESTKKTEGLISNRPSMIKDISQKPLSFRHPVGSALRIAGAAGEVLQGVPASIGIGIQQGKGIKEIASDVGKTLIGERPAEYGDIFRNVGVPEPIAAIGGLLASGGKFTPETMAFKGATKAVSSVSKPITQVVNSFGKNKVAKTLSIFSGIPEKNVKKAIENPEILNPKWLAKEKNKVQELYKKVVDPIINDNSKKVDLSSIKNIFEELGLITKDGEWASSWRSMKTSEKIKLNRWEKEIFKNKATFNNVDGIIGEIDSSLQSVYRAKEAGKAIDYSDDFKRIARQLREKLNSVRKKQYPEVAKVLDRYENYKVSQNVYNNFDKYLPHLMPSIVSGAVLGSAGIRDPRIYGATILSAVPKVQALGIRGASALGKNISKSGAIPPEIAFQLWKENQ